MADIVRLLSDSPIFTSFITLCIGVLSFLLYWCLKHSPENASQKKSKKVKDKKSPERQTKSQANSKSKKTVDDEPKIQSKVTNPVLSQPKPNVLSKGTEAPRQVPSQAKDHDVLTLEEDDWVTVKRGKMSNHGNQPQISENVAAKSSKESPKQKAPKKEPVKKPEEIFTSKSSGKSKKGRGEVHKSSDERGSSPEPTKPVIISSPPKPVEEEWQEIPSNKRKKQRARKE